MRLAALLFAIAAAVASSHTALAHTLSGVVVDASGGPVAGANVWLSQHRVPHVTRADAEGRFSFDGVATGLVQVVARKEGYALGGTEGECIDDIEIEVVLGEPIPTRLRIINTRYEPVPGARLKYLNVNDRFTVYVEDLVEYGFPSIRSDDEGFLTIPGLPKFAFASTAVSHPRYADGQLLALPAGIDELDFPLPDGEKIRGRVSDASGQGVPRARVSVYRPTQQGSSFEITEVLTGPEGFYSAMAPPGAYYVATRHPDHAMPLPRPVEVAVGEESVVDLTLPAPHRVRGKALDTQDQPVPLAVLAYRSDDYVLDETVSDATGAFELVVPESEGILHITPPARMVTVKYPRMFIQVPEESTLDIDPIRFRALPDIRGHVVAENGAAVDKVLITSRNLDPPVIEITDENGEFLIQLDRVPDRPLAFRAEHALRFLRADFEIDPVELAAPEVRLKRYRPNTEPVAGATLNDLSALVGEPAPEVACDAWFNLPPGRPSLDLVELRGKVVVLTLWAGFDFEGATRHRMEQLNALYALYRDVDDVAIVAVHDAGIEPHQVAEYVNAFGIKFPVGCDADPFQTFTNYRTSVIPQTVLIDKRGVLRHYQVEGRLLELIKELRRR